MTAANRSDEYNLLMALAHPLRRRILRAMAGEEALSPRELSDALEAPLPKVAYHVRVLAECAAVTLVRTQPVRGSMQHFYLMNTLEVPWARQILGLGEQRNSERGESPGGAGP
jgi:DNA-binding transcriptional ArsR family regulator